MINQRFTMTYPEINANTAKVFDVELVKTVTSPTGNTDTRYWYPVEIQIINDSGSGVEWLILSSDEEYQQYLLAPTSFTFIRLPRDSTLQDNFNSLGRCYKFVVKGYQAIATENLIIEFINYRPSLLK